MMAEGEGSLIRGKQILAAGAGLLVKRRGLSGHNVEQAAAQVAVSKQTGFRNTLEGSADVTKEGICGGSLKVHCVFVGGQRIQHFDSHLRGALYARGRVTWQCGRQ